MTRGLKIVISGIFAAAFIIFGLSERRVEALSLGPDPGHTGAPGEQTCMACHSGGPPGGTLTITGLPANYTPDQEYMLTVTLTQANRARYGFQATILDSAGRRAGTLTITDAARTQLVTTTIGGNQRTYVEHTFAGITPSGPSQNSWSFRWRAPAASTGRVTIYVAGNAANGDNNITFDSIYATSASSDPMAQPTPTPTPGPFVSVSAASFQQGQTLAANAIVAGFGASGLAPMIANASTVPLPTELEGTSVVVRDSAGTERLAGLFFVSDMQINYLVPEGTVSGQATVQVRRGAQIVAEGTVQIAPLGPGIFTATQNGMGLAAAEILRLRADNSTSVEPVAQFNPDTATFDPVPIDFGPEGEQIFLILYGTGFRANTGTAGAVATVGGEASQVLYANIAPGFIGLDQANLTLSRALIGRGSAEIVFTVDGQTANTVNVVFK